MREINIAGTLARKRREKGVTQDDLANFIGVSKASVSKWETEQSYPDIVFLPRLAAYFNISLDELMGYEPQMAEKDIEKLYKELAIEFGTKPFDEVMERCREIAKKYYSCFPLLYCIGRLYVNYGGYMATSISEEESAATLAEAKELCARVQEHTDDAVLKQAALHMEAYCEFLRGNMAEVAELLDNIKTYEAFTFSADALAAQAYIQLGKTKEAKDKLQTSILNGLVKLVQSVTSYLDAVIDDAEHFDETCGRTLALIDIFNMKRLVPLMIMPFYLRAAAGYLAIGDRPKSLGILETYTEIAESNPFVPTSDRYFLYIEGLAKRLTDLPRDIGSVKKSIIESVADNREFDALADEPRFKSIINKLKNII